MNGKRNLRAGPAYEKEIIDKLNACRLFPILLRTAESDPELDKAKCDIMDKEQTFPYVIQAKNTTAKAPYPKLLDEVSERHPGKVPVILHKYNRNHNGRFLVKERYAILKQEDFLLMLMDLERYKRGYHEYACYFDSIDDHQQGELDKQLKKLGL